MKTRVQPVRRKVRQLDWIMSWLVRVTPCAVCAQSMAKDYDNRNPGKSVTLHHTEGSREEDNWDDLDYVAKMVLCHVSCHRSYHLTKRHMASGKKVDVAAVNKMEENIAAAVNRQAALVSRLTMMVEQ